MNINLTCFCGSKKYDIVHKGIWFTNNKPFFIYRCKKCRLLRTIPIPKETISSQSDIKRRLKKIKTWETFGRKLISLIKQYKKNQRLEILDIGSNIGVFVKLVNENGWKGIGIDVDKRPVEIGKKKFGVDIRHTDLESSGFDEDSFDVVVLSHVLEHIFQPKALLSRIRKVLREDGILIIEVPNIEGIPVRLQKIRGEEWYGYDPEHHVWHFSPMTLRNILKQEHFEILDLSTKDPLYYEKQGNFTDCFRDLTLKISGILGMADQIRVVAKPYK